MENKADNLNEAVGMTTTVLQAQVLGERGDGEQARARGVLAQLRRNAGRPPESDPLGLSRVLLTLAKPLDESLLGKGDAATASESAAYHALTLFALHMQSARAPMHVRDHSFARACGQLYQRTESESFKPRFDALVLAQHSRSRLEHLRSIITLLRGEKLGFDYGQFAADLRALSNPKYRQKTLLRWGRDFSRIPAQESTPENS